MRILVVGAGIFGATAAVTLQRRGHAVTLIDPGPIPHPLAESTDVSKVVRIDYGADEAYTALAEDALDGWRRWNAAWPVPRFHETGVAFLAAAPMAPGGFEHDSFQTLTRRGHRLERLDAGAIARHFPAYRPGALVDGYFHGAGGWAEAGAVVTTLVAEAASAGVVIRAGAAVSQLRERDDRVAGVITAAGETIDADVVLVTAGAWTARLIPALASSLRVVGQPIFHLRPDDPATYHATRFPVFGADIARTGYYGFPLHPGGFVKIANHGIGVPIAPDAEVRAVTAAQIDHLRTFLATTLPGLAGAPIEHHRLCSYCDTVDGDFWIAADPGRPGLVVATGGSGHAFKFAPVLGDLIADAVIGTPGPLATRFGWRPDRAVGAEAARHR